MAVLSGGESTGNRFFKVYGELILVDLILEDGKTQDEGGAPNWFINTVLSRSLDFITHLPISGFWSLCAHNASSEDYLRAGIPVHFVPQSIFVSDATNNSILIFISLFRR